jgi:hypothetical protein
MNEQLEKRLLQTVQLYGRYYPVPEQPEENK